MNLNQLRQVREWAQLQSICTATCLTVHKNTLTSDRHLGFPDDGVCTCGSLSFSAPLHSLTSLCPAEPECCQVEAQDGYQQSDSTDCWRERFRKGKILHAMEGCYSIPITSCTHDLSETIVARTAISSSFKPSHGGGPASFPTSSCPWVTT